MDLDKVAHYKPPDQYLHCLQIQLFLFLVLKELSIHLSYLLYIAFYDLEMSCFPFISLSQTGYLSTISSTLGITFKVPPTPPNLGITFKLPPAHPLPHQKKKKTQKIHLRNFKFQKYVLYKLHICTYHTENSKTIEPDKVVR